MKNIFSKTKTLITSHKTISLVLFFLFLGLFTLNFNTSKRLENKTDNNSITLINQERLKNIGTVAGEEIENPNLARVLADQSTESQPASSADKQPEIDESFIKKILKKFKFGSKNIKRHAIESDDIDSKSVTSRTIKNNTIKGKDIKDGTIKEEDIKDGAITADKLKSNIALGVQSLISTGDITVGGTIYGTVSGGWTPSGNLDMQNNLISNIGVAGTDFTATGGLTLADILTITSGGASITGDTTVIGGLTVTGGDFTLGASTSDRQFENAEYHKVNGVLRAIEYRDSSNNPVRIDLFPDSAITNHSNSGTIGSIAWARGQLSSGGQIVLSCGDFAIDGTLNMSQADLTLEGQGSCTRIYALDGVAHGEFNGVSVTAAGVSIKNFELDCDGDDTTYREIAYAIPIEAANALVENITVHDMYTDAIIAMEGSTGGLVVNNHIYNVSNGGGDEEAALEAEDGAKNFTFVDNYIENATECMFPHVHLNSCGGGSDPCKPVYNVQYIRNICIAGANTVAGAVYSVNDESQGESYVVFKDNYIENWGIAFQDNTGTSGDSRMVAENNLIENATGIGINVYLGFHAEIRGNTILGFGTNAIYANQAESVLIENNVISDTDNGSTAIRCNSTNCIVRGNKVDTNSTQWGFSSGTLFTGGHNVVVDNNTFETSRGIWATVGSYNVNMLHITGNILDNQILVGGSGATANDLLIDGNTINGGDAYGMNISFPNGLGTRITNNYIHDVYLSTDHSIGLLINTNDAVIANNTIADTQPPTGTCPGSGNCNTYGMKLVGTNNEIRGNHFLDQDKHAGKQNRVLWLNADDNEIVGNFFIDDDGDLNNYVLMSAGDNNNRFINNTFYSTGSPTISDSGTNNFYFNNKGFITENDGLSDVDCGTAVSHELAGTPDYVTITPGDTGVSNLYASSLGASQFTISCTDSGDNAYNFSWRAVYAP